MWKTIELDGAPRQEACVPVATKNYIARACWQCSVLLDQLRRTCDRQARDTFFFIEAVKHHLGDFLVVGIAFDPSAADAVAYVNAVEEHFPQKWDALARCALGQ